MMPPIAVLPTAYVIQRDPNLARFTYHERNLRVREAIPAPRVSPHGGRIFVPNRASTMPIAVFYDRNFAMSGRERWHLAGAHSVMVPHAGTPRGRMIGDVKRRPIHREVPRAYGSQIPEIEGYYGEAYYYREGEYA